MNSRRLRPLVIVLAIGFVLGSPHDACAYLDPGSGSMVVQTVLALLFGAGVALRGLRHRVWAWVRGRKPAPTEPRDGND